LGPKSEFPIISIANGDGKPWVQNIENIELSAKFPINYVANGDGKPWVQNIENIELSAKFPIKLWLANLA
jgi:hypothetical protein